MRHALAALIAYALLPEVASSAATQDTEIFALVVTNNRSSSGDRGDLQYADDDGARFYALFRSVTDPTHVTLLTTFDRPSRASFPQLVQSAQPPTKSEVQKAARKLAAQVKEVRASGKRAVMYFIFAGHGDVDQGRGYLDLQDGRVDGAFIESAIVDGITADEHHIILDSCDSFFVLNPRKVGGRRWATPKDMAMGFVQRHPRVGLLLSTNSEAEVYEWSEIESGIFSHEVRSGLSGAADVNNDGQVSYIELAGFVHTANRAIPRAQFRPQIFFRGPGGNDKARLWPSASANGTAIDLGQEPMRLWIRGTLGQRLIDLHKDQGAMKIVVPGLYADGPLTVVQQAAHRPSRLQEMIIEQGGNGLVNLALLPTQASEAHARGTDQLFRSLFSQPHGAAALHVYERELQATPPNIYGLGEADRARMRSYLVALATSEQEGRLVYGFAAMLAGFAAGASAAVDISRSQEEYSWASAIVSAATGLAIMGGGLYYATRPDPAHKAVKQFELDTGPGGDWQRAVMNMELSLEKAAQKERRRRKVALYAGCSIAALELVLGSVTALMPSLRREADAVDYFTFFGGAAFTLTATGMFASVTSPTEKMLGLYRSDPDGARPQIVVAPVQQGAVMGLRGRF